MRSDFVVLKHLRRTWRTTGRLPNRYWLTNHPVGAKKKKSHDPPTKMFQMSKTPNPLLALKKIIDIIPTKGFEIRYFSSHDTILKRADSRDMLNSGHCHLLEKKKRVLSVTLFPHITLQHSAGQLSSRVFDNLADFLKLFLCLCRFVLGVLILSANETQLTAGRWDSSTTYEKVFFFFFLLYRKNNKACRL